MKYYLDIPVVRVAHQLVKQIYKITESFPKQEQYGLTNQLRRAAVSIPTNICEGKGHGNDREMKRYLGIARASLAEVTYLIFLAHDLQYINEAQYKELTALVDEIGKMSAGFHTYLVTQIESKRPRPKG